MMYWFIAVGILILVIVGYILLAWFQADKEVKDAPREDMTECHSGKHGAYPKKYAILSNDYGTREPVLICPFCYDEACKKANAGVGLKGDS